MFFNKKPKLFEIIPDNYVDIHSHLLPGIDDGAKDLKETTILLESMVSLGFKKAITTPHTKHSFWDNTSIIITEKKNEVVTSIPELSNTLQLSCASEYFIDEYFMDLARTTPLLSLKDNFILIELSYLNPPLPLIDYLFELQLLGYSLVLAHPERYVYFHSNFKEFDQLKEAGCYFQMNLLSAVGHYGKDIAKAADKLLKGGYIDFVGSDIHNIHHIDGFSKKLIIKNVNALQQAIEKNSFFS